MMDPVPKWGCLSPILNIHLGICKFGHAQEESENKNESETDSVMKLRQRHVSECERALQPESPYPPNCMEK